MQIIINAGGTGSRLWPISTEAEPKQFCKLIGQQSMLQIVYNRLIKKVPNHQIWVTTNSKHSELVKLQLPNLDPEHILTEPSKKDTFPAVAAHSAVVASKTSLQENIIFIPADSWVQDEASELAFLEALSRVESALDSNQFEIIVAGIKPTFPSTQLGYIELESSAKNQVFNTYTKVKSFKEKPNYEKALEFYESGNYLWNFGLFAFKFENLIQSVERLLPEDAKVLNSILAEQELTLENFNKLTVDSFDFAILERVTNLGLVGIDMSWDDIGNYDVLYKYLAQPESLDVATGLKVQIAGQGNRVRLSNPNKKVAFVGVSNLVLVETEEGIIVVDPKKSGEVKNVSKYFEGK